MACGDVVGGIVDVGHVQIAVAIVAHEDQRVLPSASVLVLHVADGLVYHSLGVVLGGDGEASNGHVELVGAHLVDALSIIEQAEEAIVYEAFDLIERVLALKAKQVIVGVEVGALARKHAVIPHAIAEKQQVTGHIGVGLGAVIEHLEVPTVSVGIGCATGKLIE